MKKLLVVVDMQNDFVNGSLGSPQAQSIVSNVEAKIKEYLERNDFIVFTRDTHEKNYLETQEGKNLPVEHCIFGTHGWEIHKGLDSNCVSSAYINKPSFGWKHWDDSVSHYLAEIDEIELVGLCTDICVVSNALILKAQYPEMKISVDASCCAGVTDESHKAALITMKMCQINVVNE